MHESRRQEEGFCRVVKTPKLPKELERGRERGESADDREGGNVFWGVMVVNVCACRPGQQHFPSWQESHLQRDVVHRATSLHVV